MPIQDMIEPEPQRPPPPRSRSAPPPPRSPTPSLVRPPRRGSVADWALRSHCADCFAEPGQWCFGYDISERRERLAERAAELAATNSRPELAHAATLIHAARIEAGRKARLREHHRLLGSGHVERTTGYRPTWTPIEETKSYRRAQRRKAQLAAVLDPAAIEKIDRKLARELREIQEADRDQTP